MKKIRTYFISGLLIWIPLGLSVLLVKFFINLTDGLVPFSYRFSELTGFDLPGVDVALMLLIVLLTGAFTANIIGSSLLGLWNRFLNKIPGFSNVYNAIKQISDTILTSSSNFEKVLLIEYPRKGLWTIAFKTGNYKGEVERAIGVEIVNIYVPTTPNPTSGFFIMIPKDDVIELNMSTDDALKLIISGGIVSPDEPKIIKHEKKI